MSNSHIEDTVVLPNTTETNGVAVTEDTIPDVCGTEKNGLKICVKFNKEMRELSMDEASALAQKGLKYDTVKDELERLKKIAASSGKNITDFITEMENQKKNAHKNDLLESCSGNEELVNRIIELEGNSVNDEILGFSELRNEFPNIKEISDVPSEVLEEIEIKGGNLFDAYLRYLHKQTRQATRYMEQKNKTEQSSVGSQLGHGSTVSNANEEFIKGLWN